MDYSIKILYEDFIEYFKENLPNHVELQHVLDKNSFSLKFRSKIFRMDEIYNIEYSFFEGSFETNLSINNCHVSGNTYQIKRLRDHYFFRIFNTMTLWEERKEMLKIVSFIGCETVGDISEVELSLLNITKMEVDF